MREIKRTRDFKRDFKREKAGVLGRKLDELVAEAVAVLANDQALPDRFHDHMLSGKWKDNRDCHIRPDLVLIYRKPDDRTLELVRLGSHSELGLVSRGLFSISFRKANQRETAKYAKAHDK